MSSFWTRTSATVLQTSAAKSGFGSTPSRSCGSPSRTGRRCRSRTSRCSSPRSRRRPSTSTSTRSLPGAGLRTPPPPGLGTWMRTLFWGFFQAISRNFQGIRKFVWADCPYNVYKENPGASFYAGARQHRLGGGELFPPPKDDRAPTRSTSLVGKGCKIHLARSKLEQRGMSLAKDILQSGFFKKVCRPPPWGTVGGTPRRPPPNPFGSRRRWGKIGKCLIFPFF